MSYCVQCGVQLAHDLNKCPLCGTPVVNPNAGAAQKRESEQPERVEEAISRLDRGYARQLSILFILVPALSVLLVDIIDGGGIWSPFVIGALVMLWFFLAAPLVLPVRKPYLYVTLDVLALSGYLALVAFLTRGFSWYLSIVLPLLVLLGGITLLVMLVFRREKQVKLYRAALFTLLLGAFLIGLEIIIDLALWREIRLGWSVYAGIPLAIIALMAFVLEQRKGLKEEIRKRLFI